MKNEKIEYKIIIETDKYAGNFEREMTAFMTGAVDDYDIGAELKPIFKEECSKEISLEIENLVEFKPDDHGTYRPCAIRPNKNGSYNFVEIYLCQKPRKEILELLKERAFKYAQNKSTYDALRFGEEIAEKMDAIKILNVKLIEVKTKIEESEVEI